jgi:hypothetical protein
VGFTTSKTCLQKYLYCGYCVAPDAVIRRVGRGAPRTSNRLKDWLCRTLIEHPKRTVQSQDRDMQSLLKRFSEKQDEIPACAERRARAQAAVISFAFELFLGFA